MLSTEYPRVSIIEHSRHFGVSGVPIAEIMGIPQKLEYHQQKILDIPEYTEYRLLNIVRIPEWPYDRRGDV